MRDRAILLTLLLIALAGAGVRFSAASFSSGSANSGNAIGSHSDWRAPTASASVIAKATGGSAGHIRQGTSYHIYANVADSGNPASGTSSATANVSSITTGASAASLTAGSYSIDGTTYNYRSAALTANATLAAGSYSYTLSLADAAANSTTQSGFSVTADNTAPAAADVQTTNVTGGTLGKPELGDRLLLSYSEPVDPSSIISGWSGAAANVVVRITDGGILGNDVLTVRNAANAAQLALGSVDLRRRDYVTATRDFGASGTPSQMVQNGSTIALTLGTPSGSTTTAASAASILWTPSASATDRAGNTCSTTAATESGAADLDF